ncbi:MAG TPA: TIGR04282 family arsenosugar biosynthesis glycosyltransferase [Acetobacteraceae bacterium]|nr:TIGR04282 family arsenosugar biosynthesis glycosyltransferase [Acetobacteraceae bacterium]
MNRADTCAMAVMAKAPRPNHAKTRLVPPLTPQQAAALSACFLRDITENIREAGCSLPLAGYVAYAPAGTEALFRGMLAADTRLVLADGSVPTPPGIDGFGRSLFHAVASLLGQGYGAVCLVNSDSPTLPTAYLRQAAEALARPGDRMVLGVSDDGGYYLIGLKAPHAALFRDIAWSTEDVSTQTLARAAALRLEVVALPLWFDVDDAASLERLIDQLPCPVGAGPAAYPADATRRWVAEHGWVAGGGASHRKIPPTLDMKMPPPLTDPGRDMDQSCREADQS